MLLLLPTRIELQWGFPELTPPAPGRSVPWLSRCSLGEPVRVGLCGFGLAAAGALAAAAWSAVPGDAVLAGLAGTYDAGGLPLGAVLVADAVEVHGIGFGEGDDFVHPSSSAGAMAAQWRDQEPAAPWVPAIGGRRGRLLSVAAASADARTAAARRARHPGCAAEEMEAAAVLHAATGLGRRLAVVRGISNVAGDRDPRSWRPEAAMSAVRAVLDEWLRP